MDHDLHQVGCWATDLAHFCKDLRGFASARHEVPESLADGVAREMKELVGKEDLFWSERVLTAIVRASFGLGSPYENAPRIRGASGHHLAVGLFRWPQKLFSGLTGKLVQEEWPRLRTEVLTWQWSEIDWLELEARIAKESYAADELIAQKPARGGAPDGGRSVDERMWSKMRQDGMSGPCWEWTVRRWMDHLGDVKSPSTIHETPAWKAIMAERAGRKRDRMR